MRSALLKLFRQSPFDGLLKHAEHILEAERPFRLAFLAYLEDDDEEFEKYHNAVTIIENKGDGVKRNIRGHLPRGILLPVDKFQLLWFLREQDKILDSVQDSLHWLSFRKTPIPDEMVDEFLLLVEKIGDVLRSIHPLISTASEYFKSFSEEHRTKVKEAISEIRDYEFQSDLVERKLLSDVLSYSFENPTSAFHLARLIEYMGDVSNHAENAGDMMRAMISK